MMAAGRRRFPPPGPSGVPPPVGRRHCHRRDDCGQDADRRFGLRRYHPHCRRCLLKGCERWFLPARAQARYCSVACRQQARRWRRWQAGQRYRNSEHGKQHRRDQSRRYRVRVRQRSVNASPETVEGQRPADIPEQSAGQPCHRPGCYGCFAPAARSPQQRFCCCSCRQALRRVRQRDVQRRQRRRHGARPRFRRRC